MLLTKKTQQKLEQILKQAVEQGETAGISLLIQGKDGECYVQEGWADQEQNIPIERDSIFRLYSMSKPITAAAAMILMEQGKLDLGEKVSYYLPAFENQKAVVDGREIPVENPMIVKDLLNMTSGLTYEGQATVTERQTGAYLEQMKQRLGTDHSVTTREAADHLGTIPLKFLPGTSWCYSMSADVLGAVIEQASGMRFGDFLQQFLFDPLEMEDTGFWVPEEKQHRLTKVYQKNPDGKLTLYTDNHLAIQNAMNSRPAFESGGAGLVSTIDDYAKFARMLLNGGERNGVRVMEPGTAAFFCGGRLSSSQQNAFDDWRILNGYTYQHLMRFLEQPSRGMCLGSQGEYGWDGWLGCYFSNDPAHDMSILAMQQIKDAGFTPVLRRVRNAIFSEIL
ncbi:MAG: serine hydrolase domain-containing protein [Massiliimalia sp.]|jgi:CubicO group peptidase (beta-lactamase class C family)